MFPDPEFHRHITIDLSRKPKCFRRKVFAFVLTSPMVAKYLPVTNYTSLFQLFRESEGF